MTSIDTELWKTFWQRLAVLAAGNAWALVEIVDLKGRR
jgi:hypothetical protein